MIKFLPLIYPKLMTDDDDGIDDDDDGIDDDDKEDTKDDDDDVGMIVVGEEVTSRT